MLGNILKICIVDIVVIFASYVVQIRSFIRVSGNEFIFVESAIIRMSPTIYEKLNENLQKCTLWLFS